MVLKIRYQIVCGCNPIIDSLIDFIQYRSDIRYINKPIAETNIIMIEQCPNLQTRVFVKTSPKRSYSVIETERFGLVFAKTVSIISGTGLIISDNSPRAVTKDGCSQQEPQQMHECQGHQQQQGRKQQKVVCDSKTKRWGKASASNNRDVFESCNVILFH